MDFQGKRDDYPLSFTSRGRTEIPCVDNRDDFIRTLANNCFSKTFSLKVEEECWKLPVKKPSHTSYYGRWEIAELCELKKKLNDTKSKLNTFSLAEWHKHTNFMNPAGLVLQYLRSFNIELRTQAWCKLFELLNVFKVIPENLDINLNTVHLCEAPGAFIAAMNHYLKLKHPNVEWHWIANTLNPYYEGNSLDEMINDDRFIYKTLDNWWFGEDYTGNIRAHTNIENLEFIVGKLGPINIITADGSVDCLKNPAEQEAHVSPLHYAEAIAALKILSEGGSFVLKIFTIFECETICLLYLLCTVFKTVSLHKPVVSKEGNSEVYVVCCDYFGQETCSGVLEEMMSFNENAKIIFRKEDLPEGFLDKIVKCSSFFTDLQIKVLEKNINSYRSSMSHKKKMLVKRVRNTVAELFIQRFAISSLPNQSCYIIKDQSLEKNFNHVPKNEEGTFQQRQELLHLDKNSHLLRCQEILQSFNEEWNRPKIVWFELDAINSICFKPIVGKPITQVKSSKFCRGNLITVVSEVECYENLVSSKSGKLNSRLVEYFSDFPSDYHICDVSNDCFISNFYEYQKESLKTIIAELKKVSVHGNFVLRGLSLLTQFSTGVAYTIGLAFSEVGVVCPEEVGYYLVYKNLTDCTIFLKLYELWDKYISCDTAVISILPLKLLCDGDWCRCITRVNHIALKSMALNKISSLLHKSNCN